MINFVYLLNSKNIFSRKDSDWKMIFKICPNVLSKSTHALNEKHAPFS